MEGAGQTVHIAGEPLTCGTYAATVPLLTDAVDVDVMVVGIKFLLADGDALFRGADVDGVLVFVVCHKKVLRFSISRNGGLRVRLQKGCRKLTTARQRCSPFRSAATRSKGSRHY